MLSFEYLLILTGLIQASEKTSICLLQGVCSLLSLLLQKFSLNISKNKSDVGLLVLFALLTQTTIYINISVAVLLAIAKIMGTHKLQYLCWRR